jgi:hypothetical protein
MDHIENMASIDDETCLLLVAGSKGKPFACCWPRIFLHRNMFTFAVPYQ